MTKPNQLSVRVKEQFDVLLQESKINRHFSNISESLDKRLQNINLKNEDRDEEKEKSKNSAQHLVLRQDVDHIPRSSGLQTFVSYKNLEKQSNTTLRHKEECSHSKNSSDSNKQVMEKFSEIISKIENCHRAFGKDGKFQRFICFAVRDHILHKMLTPLASSRPTLEMYDGTSFLRSTELRSFLYDILKSLDEYNFFLESSITSGIEID